MFRHPTVHLEPGRIVWRVKLGDHNSFRCRGVYEIVGIHNNAHVGYFLRILSCGKKHKVSYTGIFLLYPLAKLSLLGGIAWQ